LSGGQSARARPVRTRSSSCPGRVCPWDGGFAVSPPAGRVRAPSPVPTPRGDSHHGPLPGESPGILRVHHPRLGRWGTITRTDMGVQQGLNLADSQPGTHRTHVVSSRQWGLAPLSAPPRTRYPVKSREWELRPARDRASLDAQATTVHCPGTNWPLAAFAQGGVHSHTPGPAKEDGPVQQPQTGRSSTSFRDRPRSQGSGALPRTSPTTYFSPSMMPSGRQSR
jgi:hypothetical protein